MSYVCNDIQVLTGLEAVRKRPFMYVGRDPKDIPVQLLACAFQTVEMDAALGVVHNVTLALGPDCQAWMTIDGPAVPVTAKGAVGHMPVATYFATQFLVGGPYPQVGSVGWPALNALSTTFELHVFKNGQKWTQTFTKGVEDGPLALEGATRDEATLLNFKLDVELLGPLTWDVPAFLKWFQTKGPVCNLKVVDPEGKETHVVRT